MRSILGRLTKSTVDTREIDASFFESRDAITRFLFLQDEPTPVDLCFVLGCPTPTNMDPAIELYRKGFTRKILISGHGRSLTELPECELFRRYAMHNGVPESALMIERKATNTFENFAFTRTIVEAELGWKNLDRVALVTKPFHMRRAVMTARAQWPGHLQFLKLPPRQPDDVPAATWWQTESGRNYVFAELRAIGTHAASGHLGGF
ncbi:MAG: YdcF family protein [Chthoniobacterales bacterium]|nr:YdcF family protein [Chthoniobacterales bacterium]